MCDSDNKEPFEIRRVEEWTRDKSENTLELKVYSSLFDKPLFMFRDSSARVKLDITNMILRIEGNGMTYCYAIDYWYCKQDRYVVHTTSDEYICFVDWSAVNDLCPSWQEKVSVI